MNVRAGKGSGLVVWSGGASRPAPGTYQGTVVVAARNAPATTVTIRLQVSDELLADGGDGELWRHSRLRWLDSTIGLDDEVFEPYLPVREVDQRLTILGRAVQLADSGLLASITSSFSRNVDDVGGSERELLAEPMRFVVQPEGQPPLVWSGTKPTIVSRASGAVTWEAISTAGEWQLNCRANWSAMAM